MSGHSKWHNIQQRKGKQDAKRSSSFSKHAKMISVIARQGGGDIDANFSLRLAVDRAKSDGVPKDNIERAIKSGTGELKGVQIEEITYEAYGPGGVAILINIVTDNKNRTLPEIKNILSKNGGSMGSSGGVLWMFERWGIIVVDKTSINDRDEFELTMMDVGAEDIIDIEEDKIQIKTKTTDLQTVVEKIKEIGVEVIDSGLEWVAKEKIKVETVVENKLNTLFGFLSEHDDVEDFYTNAE